MRRLCSAYEEYESARCSDNGQEIPSSFYEKCSISNFVSHTRGVW